MKPGCTIIGTVVAKPDTRAELQEILHAQVEPTRAEAGCLNYDFHADAKDPCVFVFYENWTTLQDLDAHLTKPHLKPLFDRQGELLARPVEIRHLEMLSDMAG
ncbi:MULTISPECIES: putative quinol monooxygenase [Limimaricola]|uniref:Antibiotic biosynthesis monooxygenase n=1 Tax=Limimaricola cinnabarinus TaxID=1125964 RepID=A0A2G1MCL0_9RHOB|nr:putative quinol monooxygenase [Limimaricola cinnabarinus]PHP26467.1 antibiotic biosynthesis monooxygenase [Limimaricola cinnabarinus]